MESGPAKAEPGWRLLQTAAFVGMCLYFLYDGAWGYPNANRRAGTEKLRSLFDNKVQFDDLGEKPDKPDFEALLERIDAGIRNQRPVTRDEIHALLGKPVVPARSVGQRKTQESFASIYGIVHVEFDENGRVTAPTGVGWEAWHKTKREIRDQFFWAALIGAISLYFFWKLIRAVTLRVVIDDTGMIYGGRRIAFDDMVALKDYSPKGWVDLHYRAGGAEKRLRLDHEKVARFEEIAAAICSAKGFANPIQEYRRQQETVAASEESGEQR
jgi:hypothetical protein